MKLTRFILACGLAFSCGSVYPVAVATSPAYAQAEEAQDQTVHKGLHALALHGSPKYGPEFSHFDYVNPEAPRGGSVRLGAFGSFDSLNPFILKGESASGLSLLYDTLLAKSADEPFSEYGLLAERIDLPEDRSWVAFDLREEARFSDGTPVRADDVVWTFNTLIEKGSPYFRSYYAEVEKVEALGEYRVKFTFKEAGNRELPLIVGQMAVLPRHYWEAEGRAFEESSLDIPVGSGPYRVVDVDAGRSITFERRDDYWADDLPVNKGRFNFGQIRYDYYKDLEVMFQAFKAGELDFTLENSSRNWAVGYDVPAVKEGNLVKETIAHQDPQGMQAFVFNTRRDKFSDVRVRKAIALLMDFEWLNANLFYGQYTRNQSFFSNSDLACLCDAPPQGDVLALLRQYEENLPPGLLSKPIQMPETDGSGSIRPQMREAVALLKEAGYELQKGQMVHQESGKPLTFQILLVQENFIRVAQPFVKNLERIGIEAKLRRVDSAQYINRIHDFDFDMIVHTFGQSISPGNEQVNYWNSARADIKGSGNLAGVNDPVVDALVNEIIRAPDRESLVTRVRALDRVLLWGWYVVPQWHVRVYRVAYWNKFSHPETLQKYGLGFIDTWWVDPAKAETLKAEEP